VPVWFSPAEARSKLEGAEEAVDGDADKVQHHGQRLREEPGVVRHDLRTATDLDKAEGASHNRDNTERN
jgi:hypothetical protein